MGNRFYDLAIAYDQGRYFDERTRQETAPMTIELTHDRVWPVIGGNACNGADVIKSEEHTASFPEKGDA